LPKKQKKTPRKCPKASLLCILFILYAKFSSVNLSFSVYNIEKHTCDNGKFY